MQPRIAIFYGSTNGNTAGVAQRIQLLFFAQTGLAVQVLDVADYYLDEMLDFDLLIVGVPTWNTGQLQRDWEAVLDELGDLDLTGKVAALFGLGDQVGYPDTFGDALFFVADRLRTAGCTLVGAWPVAGYRFSNSWAVVADRGDEHFIGLMLDEDTQAHLTELRLSAWLTQLWQEFQNIQEPIQRNAQVTDQV